MQIIGHEKQIKELKRLADENALGSGYVFFGTSMVGKRTVAHALANYLENGEFKDPELLVDALFIDAKGENSVGIDVVREIKQFLWQLPNRSKRRTVVIDEAELLSTDAQNAILKIAY